MAWPSNVQILVGAFVAGVGWTVGVALVQFLYARLV